MSHVLTPIAGWFNAPCVDPVTRNLRPESTCAKVAGHLDAGRWGDALYDFIWRRTDVEKTETITMKDWIIIQQSGITAETWSEAMSKIDEAEIISVSVQQRQPVTAMQPVQPSRMMPPPGKEDSTKSEKK